MKISTRLSITAAVLGISILAALSLQARKNIAARPTPAAPRCNVVLLLDLSDRIAPARAPLQAEKDRKIITAVAELFGEEVRKKLYVNSRDTLRVTVAPQTTGYAATLVRLTDTLAIDLSEVKVPDKRTAFARMQGELLAGTEQLYAAAVTNRAFSGSDIWTFFRDGLENFRVTGTATQPVKNVLVILTDGYLNFANQKARPREGNRTSYTQIARFRHQGWEQEFAAGNYGLLAPPVNHSAWEVLVLEVAPKSPDDFPVIRKYWEQWLPEMGVTRYRVEQTGDSAKLVKNAAREFLAQ